MARYFYVKSGGTLAATADTPYTSKQTGSFATMGVANYYNTLMDAMATGKTNSPTSGDFICVSDAHYFASSSSADFAYDCVSPASDHELVLTIMSVADANCDQYAKATSVQEEATGNTADIAALMDNTCHIKYMGLWFKSGDNLKPFGSNYGTALFYECVMENDGNGDQIQFQSTGARYELYDCELIYGGATAVASLGTGSFVVMVGGKITGTALDQVFSTTASGSDLMCVGVDLSACTGNLVDGGAGATTCRASFHNCELAAGVGWNEDLIGWTDYMLITGCASSSAAAEYQYTYLRGECRVDDETSIYRDGSEAFPSGQKISLKCVTTSGVSDFSFDLPVRYAALSAAASDTVRLHLLTTLTLTDADVWVEVLNPDGTNNHVPNRAVSVSKPFDPFRTGTALTTNTEAWTGRTAENRYQIDIDTAAVGNGGADSYPTIRVHVSVAGNIFFCTDIELV